MWRISGFGDEISPNLQEQITVIRELGLQFIDLRAVWDRNIMTLSAEELTTIRTALDTAGLRVLCVGSPIGKVSIDAPFPQQLGDFRRALDIAEFFAAPYVRIFSFYMPAGSDPRAYREPVIERLQAFVEEARGSGVTLLHENETGIYGDTPERCFDLHHSIASPQFLAIWDAGNFVSNGVRPFATGFEPLRPYIAGLHIKDVVLDSGAVVVAGAGDGQFPETLAALATDGWSGFCSLEPHLSVAGKFGGFSGVDGFRRAAHALFDLLEQQGISWE